MSEEIIAPVEEVTTTTAIPEVTETPVSPAPAAAEEATPPAAEVTA